jgi:hypothetical protein
VRFFPIHKLLFFSAFVFSIQCLGIDKGDFTGVSPERKEDVFKCFDAHAYYLVSDKGTTIVNRWTQTSRIEIPPSFTAIIDRYVLLFLKNESAKNYAKYYHEKFGQKTTIHEVELPRIFEKFYGDQTNIVLQPDLVIAEDPKIPPLLPEYFTDPKTKKPFTMETNGVTFIPCFLLKDEAEAFRYKVSRQDKKNYQPVTPNFKDFLKFVEEQIENGTIVRVFGSPAEERLKNYIESLKL